MPAATWKITQPRQVIVEGNDEIRVFKSLSRHLNTRDLELQHYGGNKNLRRFLKAFSSSSDFGLVRSLAIVADALGEAAESGLWAFDTDAFGPLKDLLNIL